MLKYQKEVEKFLKGDHSKRRLEKEFGFFKMQLRNLQHERLIHLLVTLTVGMGALITTVAIVGNFSWPIFLVNIILIVLFAAYIFHYFKLENMTQSWYLILEKFEKK